MRTLYGFVVAFVVALLVVVAPVKAQQQGNQACLDAEQKLINDEGALSILGDTLSADYARINFDQQYYPDNVPSDVATLGVDQQRYNTVLGMISGDSQNVAAACPHGL